MAAEAILVETEESSPGSFGDFSFNEFRLMAPCTRKFFVLSLQNIPGSGVVEAFLVKIHEFVASSVVLTMAGITHLSSGFTRVQTSACISKSGNLGVACETLGVCYLITRSVAIVAIAHPFKVCVCV